MEIKLVVTAVVLVFFSIISRNILPEKMDISTKAAIYRVQYLSLSSCILLSGSVYIWKKTISELICSTGFHYRAAQWWKAVVLLFLVLVNCSQIVMFYLVAEEPYWFALVSFSCLGAYFILLFCLLALGCAKYCLKRVTRGWSRIKSKRETAAVTVAASSASGRNVTILAIVLTVMLTALGLRNASLPPDIVRVEIALKKLSPSLDKLKVVLLSDIHLGSTVGRSRLELIVSMVNNIDPDVVVIAGDLTDSRVSQLGTATEPLRHIKSRFGAFFTTGNHDYYSAEVDTWFSHLRSLGIQPLHNENARIFRKERNEDWICLAGVDDLQGSILFYPEHGMDVKKALTGCDPELPIILLAHQPRAAIQALKERPDISLVLSGHTHAGQIFPLAIVSYLINPLFCGLYQIGEDSQVYVSPGTVYYGFPMRLASRMEITEILLRTP